MEALNFAAGNLSAETSPASPDGDSRPSLNEPSFGGAIASGAIATDRTDTEGGHLTHLVVTLAHRARPPRVRF
jgi:hypothetical protein